MTTTSGAYQIHTEARGPHWIAWITRGSESKPERSIVLVAATEAEARERAGRWAEQTRAEILQLKCSERSGSASKQALGNGLGRPPRAQTR